MVTNNNTEGQSPTRDVNNQHQSMVLHGSPSHSKEHGEGIKNGERSPSTSSDLHSSQQEHLVSHISSLSISPPSSPVRNQGNIAAYILGVGRGEVI